MSEKFTDLHALFINCSIKKDKTGSHTQRLMNRVAGVMEQEGANVEHIYALDHTIAFGMVKDGAENGQAKDDWPSIQSKIMAADILVLGTPIWLGTKSSVATLVVERMYAYSGDLNDKGQYLYYGKTAGCVVTGNEDGVKHCAMDLLYAMQHIGYVIPPQADCGWIGEVGPGPSYGDVIKGQDTPVGYDNEFTNRNATFMAWNLLHMARMLKDNGGIPNLGNTAKDWEHVTNAKD
ncbi:MAG: flavodoxin family protein, partial [bacterium]|nr:flavodoxin family protein [bacterium]